MPSLLPTIVAMLVGLVVLAPRMPAAKPAAGDPDRAVEIVLPLRDGPFVLGELRVRATQGGDVQVESGRLMTALRPILRPEALARLDRAVGGRGFVPLASLGGAGVAITYEQGANELRLDAEPATRAPRPLSAIGMPNTAQQQEASVKPSRVSAFANVRSNVDYITHAPSGQATGPVAPAGTVDGAVRAFGPVLEGEASFNGASWYRRGTRLVVDLPDELVRVRAGDVFIDRTGFQNALDLGGISVTRLYNELAPSQIVRPTGRRTLRIDRPSDVEIFVNNQPTRRLRLQPGTYDVEDFAFVSGDNRMRIVVEDDTGRREVIDYSLFFSRELLAPGIDEFAVFAGVAAPFDDNGPGYRRDKPLASGFYRRGLTETVTAGVNAQGDSRTRMVGVSGLLASSIGSFAAELAGSQHDGGGLGGAMAVEWDLLNFALGPPGQNSLRASLEARSRAFTTITDQAFADEDDDPNNPFVAEAALTYSRELGPLTSATIGGRYALGDGDTDDAYGANLTLIQQIGSDCMVDVTLGYNRSSVGSGRDSFLGNGVTAFVSLSYTFDQRDRARLTYDTRDNRTSASFSRYGGQGNGTYSLDAQIERSNDDVSLNGDATYYGNRGEIGLAQISDAADLDGDSVENRVSVRPSFSLAYAGGRMALGRPILNSFALVGTAANLDDRAVSIGASREEEEARSDRLMPALVWDLSPYSPRRLSYDVEDLPVGYDLGSGAFQLNPPYRSGYDLTVGSAYNVTAVGTLLDERDEPVALAIGEAVAVADGDRTVSVFTNRAGRFVAQGLGPGRWRLRMDTAPPLQFDLAIPPDTAGLFRAGELRPGRR